MNNKKLIDQIILELKENPYRKFRVAFASMILVPFLTFAYLYIVRAAGKPMNDTEIKALAASALFIALCGAYISYAIIRDILDRIIFYAAQAKQSEQRKAVFVATVSHEFKTPLTIIKTNLFNLNSGICGQINPDQAAALTHCDNSIDDMNNLIDGLLSLHKVESDDWGTDNRLCDLTLIAQREIKKFAIMAKQKNLALVTEFAPVPQIIWSDERYLRSIVHNLLSNAIKYTPEGGKVILKILSEAGFIRLECVDTGPGIAADKITRIFRKFDRLDLASEGTGLGLFIIKQIIELLKGKIWVESSPGKGAKFVVLLPAGRIKNQRE